MDGILEPIYPAAQGEGSVCKFVHRLRGTRLVLGQIRMDAGCPRPSGVYLDEFIARVLLTIHGEEGNQIQDSINPRRISEGNIGQAAHSVQPYE